MDSPNPSTSSNITASSSSSSSSLSSPTTPSIATATTNATTLQKIDNNKLSTATDSTDINSTTTTTTTTTTSTNSSNTTSVTQKPKSNGSSMATPKKSTPDTDLKSLIIEFMRERPFLWNSKHLCYKDHRRRDHEFQLFSQKISCSVQEIKRVWHVLRTNFFRAHKMMLDKRLQGGGSGVAGNSRETGEKLWKYYRAMSYILTNELEADHQQQQRHLDSPRDGLRRTRSFKSNSASMQSPATPKGGRDSKASSNNNNNSNNLSPSLSSPLNLSPLNDSVKNSTSSKSLRISNCHTSPMSNHITATHSSSISKIKSMPMIDVMEVDDDNLYARSLTMTLKKFDPTTKEIIKLKFQEIIVNYMQQQQQQQQMNNQKANQTEMSSLNDKSGSNFTTQQNPPEAICAPIANENPHCKEE